ncbi:MULTISPECIES: hypothetical protein [Enterococcus]|uniref:hypothetical protein n=2 Tax=Enterococcus TaxID=1350 RepID=UPI00032E4B01|nr:hypothetical protein [Enterococcus mundtii]EOH63521.1 hypothetical protein UAC_01164 [Enterococcus mundtii ATCC 882]EOU13122.1 hypothetical protein I587_01670 [Enterococcus mundtii ATCC 882]UBM04329.1 hypothetical protein K9N66_07365 [Enterococcus mundtii]GKS53816.1 hypothetical protein EMLAB_04310 [Enterococcus mundtii]
MQLFYIKKTIYLLMCVPYFYLALLFDYYYHSVILFILLIFWAFFLGFTLRRANRLGTLVLGNLCSTITSYLCFAKCTEWHFLYHPFPPEQIILLLAGIYLFPQLLGIIWGSIFAYSRKQVK